MSGAPVVFLLLDACRSRYLAEGHLPRLSARSARGLFAPDLQPGAGFCERSEILTGTSPATNGNFSAYGFNPDASPFRNFGGRLRAWSKLPGTLGGRLATRLARRLAFHRGITMPPHRIPVAALERLCLTEDARDHFIPNAFRVDSLVDRMLAAGKRWSWHFTAVGVPNGDDDDRLDALEAALGDGSDFYLAYVERVDADGHHFGPDSAAMKTALADFDAWLARRLDRWRAHHPDMKLVVVGDHGMTSVHRHLNVDAIARQVAENLGLDLGAGPDRDVEIFLDSTLARFWFRDPDQVLPFTEALRETELGKTGRFVDDAERKRQGIPRGDRRYGDLLWWANSGVLVWPDYFHRPRDVVRGMHGYDPEHPDSRGFALIEGPGIDPEVVEGAHLKDLAATLARLMNIEAPRDHEGRSLLACPQEVLS